MKIKSIAQKISKVGTAINIGFMVATIAMAVYMKIPKYDTIEDVDTDLLVQGLVKS